jgi:hypothetical protein
MFFKTMKSTLILIVIIALISEIILNINGKYVLRELLSLKQLYLITIFFILFQKKNISWFLLLAICICNFGLEIFENLSQNAGISRFNLLREFKILLNVKSGVFSGLILSLSGITYVLMAISLFSYEGKSYFGFKKESPKALKKS